MISIIFKSFASLSYEKYIIIYFNYKTNQCWLFKMMYYLYLKGMVFN